MKRLNRWFQILSAGTALALTAALASPVAPAFAETTTLGGVASEGNLRIRVADTGQMGVERFTGGDWVQQIYDTSPGSKGSALFVNGVHFTFGYFNYNAEWAETGTPAMAVSNTLIGNTITTSWSTVNTTVTQTTQYTNGNAFYRLQWQITNTSGSALSDLRFFHGEDTYLLGGDKGAGFWDSANHIVGVYKTDLGGNQQRMSLQGVTPPAHYQSEAYDSVLIAGGTGRLTDVLNPDPETDNGYALEWNTASLAAGATWTITAYESFTSGVVGALNVVAPISTDCAPGATCDIVYTVSNPTGGSVDAELSVAGSPSAWSPTIISPESPVTIGGGTSQNVTVRLTIPADATNGTAGSFTLTANDGTSDTSATAAVNVVAAASTNADLSDLVTSTGVMTPTFSSDTTSYSLAVPNATTSLTVTATAADTGSTIKVNGTTVPSGSASDPIALSVGDNTINTVVTAEDGTTTKTYTITVTRAAISTNANLSGLALSAGTLSPSFAAGTTSYTATVSNATANLTVTPTAADSGATIKVNGATVTSGSASGSIALSVGDNTITTVVTAGDGETTKTYTVTVTRAASANADLSGLALSAGTLSPTFAAGTTSYTATVSNATTSLTITPTVADATATVTVNGATVTSGSASGSIALNVGDNSITTIVTAQDGSTTKTYTVIVTRAPSANANLSALSLSAGTLTPTFAAGTTTYTATVSNATTGLTITPTTADATATVTVNGSSVTSGNASSTIPLSVGDNTITTIVTAQDGTTSKTYTVTVTRAPSSNANLSALALSAGTLSPTFAAGTTSYTATVSNATTSLTATPTVADANATVTVNGTAVTSGNASGSIALAVGDNTVTVVVTAQDGTTTKTYTVVVTRAASSNADLSQLTLSAGTLSPTFDAAATSYTATVAYAVSSLTITPTAAEGTATITVNGDAVASGSASSALPLTVGDNTVSVVVTAGDGVTTRTTTVTITRQPSSNTDLAGLALSTGTLTPAFDPATTSYTATVPNATASLSVTVTVSDTNATLTINGDAAISGNPAGDFSLDVGDNIITAEVTAQDGTTTQTYTITVTRAASSDADLSDILVAPGTLDPAFDPATLDYTVAVSNNVSAMAVIPSLADPTATYTMSVNGESLGIIVSASLEGAAVPANVPLEVGANLVTIVVTAQDGVTTKTYTVTANRAGAANADLSDLNDDLGGLLPGFSPEVFTYEVTVECRDSALTFQPTSSDPHATILVNGAPVTSGANSGSIALNPGSNVITITVIAGDGVTSQTYTITVFRPYAQILSFIAKAAMLP